MVAAAELGQRATACRGHTEGVEQLRQLAEVDVEHEELCPQLMGDRTETTVAHPAFVDAARRHHSPSTARSAETTPSSWNPQPQ